MFLAISQIVHATEYTLPLVEQEAAKSVGGGITFLVMSGRFKHAYNDIISVENVLGAWKEFLSGKRSREDVRIFESTLMDNIFLLHYSLANRTYRHGAYHSFNITDPKPRNIHKASVKDRLLHHAIHRILYPSFDRTFIFDSYSCRDGKGIHKALNRFKSFFFEASKNNTRTVWVLKCDIRKFFASIYHKILMSILAERIHDQDILFLLDKIISSFQGAQGKGVPLGNLTSQLFANIYMNEFDHFMKRHMCAKYYIRYADDFVILSDDREYLEGLIPRMSAFLGIRLGLDLHPNKMFIKSFASGVDFLGWVHFPDHRVLRTVTKRRMFKNLRGNSSKERLSSYRGLMSHGNTHILQAQVENLSKN